MADIELHSLSDREILLLLVQEQKGTNARLDKQNGTMVEHSNRLRDLEAWRSVTVGGLGVLTTIVVPLTIAFLTKLL